MPSSDPAQRFTDIIENIDSIERFTQGMDARTFATNDQVVFAVKYALMIISEAAIRLGDIATRCNPIFHGGRYVVSAIGSGTNTTSSI